MPVFIHNDDGRPGGGIIPADEGRVHVVLLEIVEEKIAEVVLAHAPEHGYIRTEPRRGDGLICTLAAGDDLQISAADRLAGLWKPRRTHNEIGIQRTRRRGYQAWVRFYSISGAG